MTTFAVVDLETTGNQKQDRIIEIGIVIYRDQQIVSTYQTLINPHKHISRFIEHLTGINNAMVMDQPTFEDVATTIHHLLDDAYFVAHNVPFDLGFLNQEFERVGLEKLTSKTLDTVELSRMMLPAAPGFKLNQLAQFLSITHDDPHRALSDAYVTTDLLKVLLEELASLPKTTLKKLLPLSEKLKSDLVPIIHELLNKPQTRHISEKDASYDYHYGLAIRRVPEIEPITKQPVMPSFGEWLDQFEAAFNTPLRFGQREMSEAIYHAFVTGSSALIEAGTGIGKTMSYLLAAIYVAKTSQEKVVISTYLKQLQKQLLHEEVPKILDHIKEGCRIEVLKGKNQYISVKRFSEWIVKTDNDHYDFTLTKAIVLIWLTKTETGDVDEIQLPRSGYQLFHQFSHRFDSDEKQAFSYYEYKLTRIDTADIVIVNHALMHQLVVQEKMPLNRIIIDEAHHLPEVIEQEEGLMFHSEAIHAFLNQVIHRLKTFEVLDAGIKATVEDIKYDYQCLIDFTRQFISRQLTSKGTKKIVTIDPNEDVFLTMQVMYERFKLLLDDLLKDVYLTPHPLIRDELTSIVSAFLEPYNRFFFDDATDAVYWLEMDMTHQQHPISFYKKPVDIRDTVKRYYFAKGRSVILTSATLTVNQRFDYLEHQLGITKQVNTYRFPALYPTEDHVQLLVPNDFPRLDQRETTAYVEALSELVFSLADLTKGRMLILFNSYQMLKDTHVLLEELFQDDYVLIAQGISSGSHEKLKKHFQQTDQAILLGTHAFWEGLDIPGDDLKCVVIARLPFQSPSQPVVEAKLKRMESNGQSGFYGYSLPDAVIRFKQGFGRLIRSETDAGIVVVTDDRIVTKSYGRTFIESLPSVPVYHRRTTELLDMAQTFLTDK
ncbi:MAG: ATP-dependent DNA helicase DinG [Bacillota bacterium]